MKFKRLAPGHYLSADGRVTIRNECRWPEEEKTKGWTVTVDGTKLAEWQWTKKEAVAGGRTRTRPEGRTMMDESNQGEKMSEDKPCVCRTTAPCATAESVLRELNAFLRELLEEKRHWYETALAEQKAKSERWFQEALDAGKDRERLRIALAEAIREIAQHNVNKEWETDDSLINSWDELLEVK